MERIVFTKDEIELLRRLAKARRETPGQALRRLVLQDALRRRLLEPEQRQQAKAVRHA